MNKLNMLAFALVLAASVLHAAESGNPTPAEASAPLPAGPVQGSPALQAQLKSEREAVAALQASGAPDAGTRIEALKAAGEQARLELLILDLQSTGRLEELAAARAELQRLRTPAPAAPLVFQPRQAAEGGAQ